MVHARTRDDVEQAPVLETAVSRDGGRVAYRRYGSRWAPAILVSWPFNAAGSQAGHAGEHRQFVDALADRYHLIVVEYPRGLGGSDLPGGALTAELVASDHLAVADAAGVERFVMWGYSGGAHFALQTATRHDRVAGVVCGGWPPLSGPYALTGATLRRELAAATDERAVALLGLCDYFDDVAATWDEEREVARLDGPRICYYGSDDDHVQGGIGLRFADTIRGRREDLEAQGWRVLELPGHDHMSAAADVAAVVPRVRAVLDRLSW